MATQLHNITISAFCFRIIFAVSNETLAVRKKSFRPATSLNDVENTHTHKIVLYTYTHKIYKHLHAIAFRPGSFVDFSKSHSDHNRGYTS